MTPHYICMTPEPAPHYPHVAFVTPAIVPTHVTSTQHRDVTDHVMEVSVATRDDTCRDVTIP